MNFRLLFEENISYRKARCPMKKNSIVTNDHRKKNHYSSVDTSLELKNTLSSLKTISYCLR